MFLPSKKILRNYALVMVDFALGDGKGIKGKEIVYLQYDSPAQALALEVYQRILERGGHPILKSNDQSFAKIFYQTANSDQLEFFPKKYQRSLIDTIDHRLYLIADEDPLYLKNVNPKKIIQANKPLESLRKWLHQKENQGKLTWSLCLYGTDGMAKEAGMTVEQYWQQIIKACFLELDDPIKKWQSVFAQMKIVVNRLNDLPIQKFHLVAKDTDLWIDYGAQRKFCGGEGQNIPSFEIFTSPDWRGTEGRIFFDLPRYYQGNIINDIYLEFKLGTVIQSKARTNESLLKEIIKQKNADKIGEFSLTDKRFSRIDQFMADTLYDENHGGKFGNTHLALGLAHQDCYRGDLKKTNDNLWNKLGFNLSREHTDLIATTDRVVEAVLKNGVKKLLYKDGQFVL